MIEPERAGSALNTVKNACASSVRPIGCGAAFATKQKAWPKKFCSALPALASPSANPVTNLSVSLTTNPYHPVTLLASRGEREVSERQLSNDDGDALAWPSPWKGLGILMGRTGTYRTTAINRRRTQPHEGPPAVPGHADRTAGGLGGAAPASLDSYGHNRTTLSLSISSGQCPHFSHIRGFEFG